MRSDIPENLEPSLRETLKPNRPLNANNIYNHVLGEDGNGGGLAQLVTLVVATQHTENTEWQQPHLSVMHLKISTKAAEIHLSSRCISKT